MSRPSGIFYRLARIFRDAEALGSGDPKRLATRAKNRALGRSLARSSSWRRLWR
jgi:muconolactone delta-isomerase